MSYHHRTPPRVYFIRPVGQPGPVKIGCSQAPLDRLSNMSGWSPFRLEVAARTPGDETLERRFHARFVDQHCHNEWFNPSHSLTSTIAAVAAGTFDFDTLPDPRYVPRPPKPKWTVEQRLNLRMQNGAKEIKKAGVEIPQHVVDALYRYSLWGSAHHPVSRDRPDAEIAQAFLAEHLHLLNDPRPLIAVSREAGFMLPKAA